MSLSKKEFDNYASQGFNRIPLMREVLADLDTPLSVYLKLARGPYSYLFESVQGGISRSRNPRAAALHRRTGRLLRLRNHPLRGTASGQDGQARRHRRA